jgi:hypothetical protein
VSSVIRSAGGEANSAVPTKDVTVAAPGGRGPAVKVVAAAAAAAASAGIQALNRRTGVAASNKPTTAAPWRLRREVRPGAAVTVLLRLGFQSRCHWQCQWVVAGRHPVGLRGQAQLSVACRCRESAGPPGANLPT